MSNRSQAIRESLGLRIDPSSFASSPAVHITPRSSTMASPERIQSPSDDFLFSVLCLHDFLSDDPTHLSFDKNEVLEIVRCTDAGWWAAMRIGGSTVGWIPNGYVTRVSKTMAKRLRQLPEELRSYELDVEELGAYGRLATRDSAAPSLDSPTLGTHQTTHSQASLRSPDEAAYPLRRRVTNPQLNSTYSPRPSPHPHPPPTTTSPTLPMPSRTMAKAEPATPHARTDEPRPRTRSLRRRPTNGGDDPSALALLTNLMDQKMAKESSKSLPESRPSTDTLDRRQRDIQPKRKQSQDNYKPASSSQLSRTSTKDIPWFLNPLHADQLDEDGKGNVRSGTLAALVERLTLEAPPETQVSATKQSSFWLGRMVPEPTTDLRTFADIFLMTFRTFTTADMLYEMLLERFYLLPSKELGDAEVRLWKAHVREPVQARTLDIFSMWLDEYNMLEEEPHLCPRLAEFLKSIVSSTLAARSSSLLQTLERLMVQGPISHPMPTPKKGKKSKIHKGDLLKLDIGDLAEQLTLYEHTLYAKITKQECLAYAKVQTGKAVARLLEFCKTHDRLNQWVKTSVLNSDVLAKRADLIDHWIKVAEKCRSLNNFSSMSAIVTALSSISIERLHMTWAVVGRKTYLETLIKHNDPSGAFAVYRTLLQNVDGPCVPFISMYLQDMVRSNENANAGQEGSISFYQRMRWYDIVRSIIKFQSRAYSHRATYTLPFIEDNLREHSGKPEEWFWTRSEELVQSEMLHADIRRGLSEAGF